MRKTRKTNAKAPRLNAKKTPTKGSHPAKKTKQRAAKRQTGGSFKLSMNKTETQFIIKTLKFVKHETNEMMLSPLASDPHAATAALLALVTIKGLLKKLPKETGGDLEKDLKTPI